MSSLYIFLEHIVFFGKPLFWALSGELKIRSSQKM